MAGPDPGLSGERAGAGVAGRALRSIGATLLALPAPLVGALIAAWCGLIWFLSAQTFPSLVEPVFLWELASNLAHAPLFGFLALLLAALFLRPRAAGGWPRFDAARAGLVLALVLAYGVIDEWHQMRVPGREPSAFDIVTDLTGALAVLWIVFYLGERGASDLGLAGRLLAGALAAVAAAALATLD